MCAGAKSAGYETHGCDVFHSQLDMKRYRLMLSASGEGLAMKRHCFIASVPGAKSAGYEAHGYDYFIVSWL